MSFHDGAAVEHRVVGLDGAVHRAGDDRHGDHQSDWEALGRAVGIPASELASFIDRAEGVAGDRRAEAVLAALSKRGVPPEKVAARGYGTQRPVADNETEEGRARNRRVEFSIVEQLEGTPEP